LGGVFQRATSRGWQSWSNHRSRTGPRDSATRSPCASFGRWTAYALSVTGDQLAAVAFSVLVFDRTGSPAWAALTFLPDLVGGAVLAGLADHFPRPRVMVTADVVRVVLVLAMAVPGQPLVGVIVLVVVQLLAAPFMAARTAVIPAILTGERYMAGMTIMRTTYQVGCVVGFAVGRRAGRDHGDQPGADRGRHHLRRLGGSGRVATTPASPTGAPRRRGELVAPHGLGWSLVVRDRQLRSLIGLACVSGAHVVPEGLAVAYAAQLHAGTAAVG
jgi:hypothetical protein